MRAYLVQSDLVWEDRNENFARVHALLAQASPDPGGLIVLPELFDSGFSMRTDHTNDADGATAAFLARLARDTGCLVQGGRTVLPPGEKLAWNEALVCSPTCSEDAPGIASYRKIHPFSFGREPEAFRGGDEVVTYRWACGEQGLRVCPAICYDLRFPELFRRGVLHGASVFALGANWPEARQSHWRALAIARAIENQSYMLAVNRTGHDPHLAYAGGTIAVGPRGDVLDEMGAGEGVLTVGVEPRDVDTWRETFPALRDIRLTGDGGDAGRTPA